jgi:hypothetical protein
MTKFVTTAVAAAAIGFGALMTVDAPSAHASEKSDCEGKGGTYSETKIVDIGTGKTATRYSCCVKDTATKTTSCSSTTVTNAENIQPTRPITRIPLGVLTSAGQIQQAP